MTEPVIEQIDNDLAINGSLTSTLPSTGGYEGEVMWSLNDGAGNGLNGLLAGTPFLSFGSNGYSFISRQVDGPDWGSVHFNAGKKGIAVKDNGDATKWSVAYDGTVTSLKLLINTETDNSDNYVSVQEDGEEVSRYVGPVLDVAEELQFLRAQVKALMERLKMTPEGGWPVWDGSSETRET